MTYYFLFWCYSVYDTGTDVLQDTFLACDKGYDVWEFEEKNNKRKAGAKLLDSEVSIYQHLYLYNDFVTDRCF